jgi:hypothetical protein
MSRSGDPLVRLTGLEISVRDAQGQDKIIVAISRWRFSPARCWR